MRCQEFECRSPDECEKQGDLYNIKICKDVLETVCEHKAKNKLGKISLEDLIF